MDRATTMAIINRLEARGLLVRGESKRDPPPPDADAHRQRP